MSLLALSPRVGAAIDCCCCCAPACTCSDAFNRPDEADIAATFTPVGGCEWEPYYPPGVIGIIGSAAEVTADAGGPPTAYVVDAGIADVTVTATLLTLQAILVARFNDIANVGLLVIEGTLFGQPGDWVLFDNDTFTVLDSTPGAAPGDVASMTVIGTDVTTWSINAVPLGGPFALGADLHGQTEHGIGGFVGGRLDDFSVCAP